MRADDQDQSAPAPVAVRKIGEKHFLGVEFLTWLYFTIMEEGGDISVDGNKASTDTSGGDLQAQIGKRLSLQTIDQIGPKTTVAGPGLDDCGDVLQAIRRGAHVALLALEVSIDSRVYTFTLRADDAGFVAVRLPDLFSEPEDKQAASVPVDPLARSKSPRRPRLPPEEILLLRMQCAAELERVIDALFLRFLTRRLARAWVDEDVKAMRARVAQGLKSRIA